MYEVDTLSVNQVVFVTFLGSCKKYLTGYFVCDSFKLNTEKHTWQLNQRVQIKLTIQRSFI